MGSKTCDPPPVCSGPAPFPPTLFDQSPNIIVSYCNLVVFTTHNLPFSSCIHIKVIDSSWKPNNTEHEFPGIMTDLVLTDCYLPESPVTQGYFDESNAGTSAAGLMISVSNDGEHRSKTNLTFISYDSACMSCNVSTGCHIKVRTLLVLAYIRHYPILCSSRYDSVFASWTPTFGRTGQLMQSVKFSWRSN